MKTWWITAALTAIWLGQVGTVGAQHPTGGGPLPEPAPVAPTTQPPPAVPGPLTSQGAPPGPGWDLWLPATIPTAWSPHPQPESGFYMHGGAMALQRQRPGRAPYVLRDNGTNVLDNGTIPLPRNTSVAGNLGDISPSYAWGVNLGFGYLYDDAAIEMSAFYIADKSDQTESRDIGRLMLFFNQPPEGLEGDNGLWLQADRAVATLRTAVASGELNYRWWARSHYGLEGIMGVRYLGVQEKISIFTDDDGTVVNEQNLSTDPNRHATVSVRSHNRMVAPQLGFEGYVPVCRWLGIGFLGKGAWGPNFLEVNYRVTRGDTFVGRNERRDDITFSHMYEGSAFIDLFLLEKVRFRAGYNILWAVNVTEAIDQIDYDLFQPGPRKDAGSIFFHGPMIELHVIF